jgi:ABC-type polysaccharide/polyol phosphate export permease
LIYEFFTQATKRAMRSITNSASVIKKVYVPKYIYPLSNVIANFVTFVICYRKGQSSIVLRTSNLLRSCCYR